MGVPKQHSCRHCSEGQVCLTGSKSLLGKVVQYLHYGRDHANGPSISTRLCSRWPSDGRVDLIGDFIFVMPDLSNFLKSTCVLSDACKIWDCVLLYTASIYHVIAKKKANLQSSFTPFCDGRHTRGWRQAVTEAGTLRDTTVNPAPVSSSAQATLQSECVSGLVWGYKHYSNENFNNSTICFKQTWPFRNSFKWKIVHWHGMMTKFSRYNSKQFKKLFHPQGKHWGLNFNLALSLW